MLKNFILNLPGPYFPSYQVSGSTTRSGDNSPL